MRSNGLKVSRYIVYHLRRKSSLEAKFGKNKPFFAFLYILCTRVSDSMTLCWLSIMLMSLDTVSGSLTSTGGGSIFISRSMVSTCLGLGDDTPASQFWIVRGVTPTASASSACERPISSLACFTFIIMLPS